MKLMKYINSKSLRKNRMELSGAFSLCSAKETESPETPLCFGARMEIK
ncbi:MAG: hypothetical protein ACLUUG_06175 [Lachnospiraceae bacterium]